MNGFYITIVDNPVSDFHRSKIIIHKPSGYYFAEFDSIEQLDFFAETLGFTYEQYDERTSTSNDRYNYGVMRFCRISHEIEDNSPGGFWKLSELPIEAKPIKALSNGSIVTCYYYNDGKKIGFYRPNPNAKEVYHPLTLEQHIQHVKIYGLY